MTNNVVPFKPKKKLVGANTSTNSVNQSTINLKSNLESDQSLSKINFLIKTHSINIMELIGEYCRRNDIFDTSLLTEEQYRDMVFINEAIISMFSRRAGLSHDLQEFIDENMYIPNPND